VSLSAKRIEESQWIDSFHVEQNGSERVTLPHGACNAFEGSFSELRAGRLRVCSR